VCQEGSCAAAVLVVDSEEAGAMGQPGATQLLTELGLAGCKAVAEVSREASGSFGGRC
jgi:hypothetical protein